MSLVMLDMDATKLSSKGQVVMPESARDERGCGPGTEFVIESTPDGTGLRAKAPFARMQLGQVFGSVRHAGPVKSLDDMEARIRFNFARRYRPYRQLLCQYKVGRVRG